MNNWNFTGHCGRDAESRYTPSGDAVVSFTTAVKSGFGEKATTTWANCTIWGKRGEAVAEYLKKGTLVGVSGEVTLREYQDKDGQKRNSLDVRVNDLTLLGKHERQERPQQRPAPAKDGGLKPDRNFDPFEEIPF
jgi:single-strand DNA-binding protein